MNKFIDFLVKNYYWGSVKWTLELLERLEIAPLTYNTQNIMKIIENDGTVSRKNVSENDVNILKRNNEELVNANLYSFLVSVRVFLLSGGNTDDIVFETYGLKVGATSDDFKNTNLSALIAEYDADLTKLDNEIVLEDKRFDNGTFKEQWLTLLKPNFDKSFLDLMIISKEHGLFTRTQLTELVERIKKDVKTAIDLAKIESAKRKNARKL